MNIISQQYQEEIEKQKRKERRRAEEDMIVEKKSRAEALEKINLLVNPNSRKLSWNSWHSNRQLR